jgi:hypothetical protein
VTIEPYVLLLLKNEADQRVAFTFPMMSVGRNNSEGWAFGLKTAFALKMNILSISQRRLSRK